MNSLLLLLVIGAQARTLTAADAVDLALDHSRTIDAAQAGAEKARADEKRALLAMGPKASAMYMYRYQTPLPEMVWDMSALYGGSDSGTSSCDAITEDQLPTGWTLEMAQQMCELITSWMTPTSTEPTVMTLGVHNNYTAQVAVDQVIFAGNALRQAHRAAKDMVTVSQAQVRQAEAEAAYAAVQAFYGLYMAREAVRVTADAQATVDAYVKDLSNLVTAGIGQKSDLLAAQSQQSNTRLSAMKTAHMARIAEAAFRASLGLPADEPLDLQMGEAPTDDLARSLTGSGDGALEDLVSQARTRRPEMQALDASVSALGHYSRAAWASWVPVVAFNTTYMGQNPNPYTTMLDFSGSGETSWFWSTNVSLVASWTFWDQGAALFGHKAAQASLDQLASQRALLQEMLPVEVESALSSWKEAREAVEVARLGLSQAEEAHRLEQNRFQQGVSNNTQLLAAQAAMAGARLSLLQAEITLRTSHAALRKAAGMDPR